MRKSHSNVAFLNTCDEYNKKEQDTGFSTIPSSFLNKDPATVITYVTHGFVLNLFLVALPMIRNWSEGRRATH